MKYVFSHRLMSQKSHFLSCVTFRLSVRIDEAKHNHLSKEIISEAQRLQFMRISLELLEKIREN